MSKALDFRHFIENLHRACMPKQKPAHETRSATETEKPRP